MFPLLLIIVPDSFSRTQTNPCAVQTNRDWIQSKREWNLKPNCYRVAAVARPMHGTSCLIVTTQRQGDSSFTVEGIKVADDGEKNFLAHFLDIFAGKI